ncbi:hypothetical protein DAPPUDRAFT_115509 [Daphnia pulex]|uniref:Uncharacterized protein n=1 Tax=Daphnia pulex TaxID=6669 RepID=E9HLM5_DAPPU|nr:hypothetical protein DAPPUDRAFT_115509 [Daphnia pulex]|eukprot:EFX67388.1 hypothetical protein DAPPUDRAFT_115509 [Daphnia pulex]
MATAAAYSTGNLISGFRQKEFCRIKSNYDTGRRILRGSDNNLILTGSLICWYVRIPPTAGHGYGTLGLCQPADGRPEAGGKRGWRFDGRNVAVPIVILVSGLDNRIVCDFCVQLSVSTSRWGHGAQCTAGSHRHRHRRPDGRHCHLLQHWAPSTSTRCWPASTPWWVPNEESPVAKVRTEEMAEAPKLAKESEEDSLDVAELPSGILQRRHHPSAVCPSVAITKQQPDSSIVMDCFFYRNDLTTSSPLLTIRIPIAVECNLTFSYTRHDTIGGIVPVHVVAVQIKSTVNLYQLKILY